MTASRAKDKHAYCSLQKIWAPSMKGFSPITWATRGTQGSGNYNITNADTLATASSITERNQPSFSSYTGDSCLLPASMKMWQGNLLARKQDKISGRHGSGQSWQHEWDTDRARTHRERIKVPEGRVLGNEKTHWNLRVILVVGGEKAGVRIHCPVNERSWIHI